MTFDLQTHLQLLSGRRSSFYFPMLMLPRLQREAVLRVYDFCRFTDDIVDLAAEFPVKYNPAEQLEKWRLALLEAIHCESSYPFLNRLVETARSFVIPFELFFELIRGVEMDLTQHRYATFDDLYQYCYRVASTAGLMTMRILGQHSASMQEYAVHLGIAMQLTNIIRDVGADYRLNRIYIPQEDLKRWNVREKAFAEKCPGENFTRLMQAQIDRARSFYRRADTCYTSQCVPARAVQNIYYALLLKTEKNIHVLPERRIKLGTMKKISILLHTQLTARYDRTEGVFGNSDSSV